MSEEFESLSDYWKKLAIERGDKIESLENIIIEARSIFFEGLEDGSLWVKINANNPIVKDWIEKTKDTKVEL